MPRNRPNSGDLSSAHGKSKVPYSCWTMLRAWCRHALAPTVTEGRGKKEHLQSVLTSQTLHESAFSNISGVS